LLLVDGEHSLSMRDTIDGSPRSARRRSGILATVRTGTLVV
jgi:hypothetical protein